MVSPDDRPDTRRGVLKNVAAAGLGAAIATVAARELPPWLGGPAPGVPSISRPGTMDAVFNVRDQGRVSRRSFVKSGVADDTDGEGIALMATDQSIVANCFVSRTGNHGIISKQGDENTLIGNQILQAGFNKSSGFAHGIAIDGNGGLNPNGRHRIIGNYIFDPCDAGIEVADAVDDIVIEGNTINGAGVGALAVNRYGIYFGGSLAASSKGSIRGNTVTRAKANGIHAAGLSSVARASSLVIEGNLCYGNGENGIYLKAVDNFVVMGNACFNNDTSSTEKDGIRLEGAWDGIVMGNRCYDDQAAKMQAHGLGIVAGATNVLVAMNDLSGNAMAASWSLQ